MPVFLKWEEANPDTIPSQAICLIKNCDAKDFLEYRDLEGFSQPLHAYRYREDYKDYLSLFCDYICIQLKLDPSNMAFSRNPFIESFEKTYSAPALTSIDITDQTPPIFTNTHSLTSLINEYQETLGIILKNSLLGLSPIDKFSRDWWGSRNSSSDLFLSVRSKINAFGKEHSSNYVASVKSHIDQLDTELRNLFRVSTDQIFSFASAYAFASAEKALELGEFSKSWLLLHRSLDSALNSLGIKENIILASRSGLHYKNSQFSQKPVGVLLTIKELSLAGFINLSDAEQETCKTLNNSRNNLSLAHSMYAPRKIACEKMLTTTKHLIRNCFGISPNWVSQANLFSKHISPEYKDLYDVEPNFKDLITAIPPATKN